MALSAACFTEAATTDLLVAMHGAGTVERYEGGSGRHVGTFIRGLDHPNDLAFGRDGALYIATGAVAGPGAVRRFAAASGRSLGDFVAIPAGQPGYLARASSLVWYGDDLFVASCDDSKIQRYDGITGAFKGTLGTGNPKGWITQIAIREEGVFATEFSEARVRRFALADGATTVFVEQAGFTPWGLAFDARGRCWWSGSGGIARFDGLANAVVVPAEEVQTPVRLAIAPDGHLVCSSLGRQSVTLWDTSGDVPQRLRTLSGPEMRDPAGVAFTSLPMPVITTATLARTTEPSGDVPAAVIQVVAETKRAALIALGWDTEGGSRSRVNLLRAPVEVRLLRGGQRLETAVDFSMSDADSLRYRLALNGQAVLTWDTVLNADGLDWRLQAEADLTAQVDAIDLVLPFDPRTAATSVIATEWTVADEARLPLLLSAPDLGQMLVSAEPAGAVTARWQGSRVQQSTTLTFALTLPQPGKTVALRFRPAVLPLPAGMEDRERWAAARRGWFNLLQFSAARPAEGGHGLHPPGLWANNVISDPVCNTTYWLGLHALLVPELAPGLRAADLLKRTLDYWLDHPADDVTGRLRYTVSYPSLMADANPSLLFAAWCYIEAGGDLDWLRQRIGRLEWVARYLEQRDVDHDGLIESEQSGNRGTGAFGDTAWDTYSSGHKNAYVNALAYRAWLGLAALERRLGRTEPAASYAARATQLQAAFVPAFFNPETGWLGWWRSADGELHDIASAVPTSLAVECGVISPAEARPMLERLSLALAATGFSRFDLGIPSLFRPIEPQLYYNNSPNPWPYYLNGGACVSNTSYWLNALYLCGLTAEADRILDAMLRRQSEGVYPNGGGFQNGIVDRYPDGAEFFTWDGKTAGYEGHLVYSWTWLHALFTRQGLYSSRVLDALR
jgi:sugar lactone lactonase YvrE